jgi:hypothetical protein
VTVTSDASGEHVDLVGLIRRTWHHKVVTLPVIVLTVVAAIVVQSSVEPRLEARGTVLLAEPQLDPSLAAADVVDTRQIAVQLRSEESVASLAVTGATADFVVNQLDEDVVEVVANGPAAQSAVATAELVTERMIEAVDRAQEDAAIPEAERLQARVTVEGVVAEELEDGTFRAVSTVSFVDPAAGIENPFTASLSTARVLQVAITSETNRARVEERTGEDIEFEIGLDPNDSAPIIEIFTYGADPARVLESFQSVRGVLGEELDARQSRAGIPGPRRISIEVLSEPLTVTDVSPPIGRTVAAIIVLGGALVLGLVWLREGRLGRDRQAASPVPQDAERGAKGNGRPSRSSSPGTSQRGRPAARSRR